MITRAQATELRTSAAADSAVLSLYLPIPVDLAAHRGLATRARELIKSAAEQATERPRVRRADIESITQAITSYAHEWLGHTAAIFANAELGLFQALALPSHIAERAVVGARPHIRPLLIAMQRSPAYRAVVIDSRHAWLFAISDHRIETVAERNAAGMRSAGFAGWSGLEAFRVQQRLIQLARQHFRDTIGILERTDDGVARPLVIGGHQDEINQFVSVLPHSVRQSVAGSFNVDLRTVTPARVRELASPVIARWAENTEAKMVADVLSVPPNSAAMTDLAGCIRAARTHAVAKLIVPDEPLIPGFACDDCRAVSMKANGCDCPDPASACRAIPDVLDELAGQTLEDGGQVISVRNPPFMAAARLRFPVAVSSGSRLP